MILKRALLVLPVLMVLGACGDAPPTPFVRAVEEPLAPNEPVAPPKQQTGEQPGGPKLFPETALCHLKDAQGHYDETIVTHSGEKQKYSWGEGGGCLHRNIREAWGVLHNQPVIVWGGVDHSEFKTLPNGDARVTHRYEVTYQVHDFITVEWIMEWIHTMIDGTVKDPKHLIVHYQRTRGSGHVPYWEGSIELQKMTEEVTAVSIVDQIRADQTGAKDSEGSVKDLIDKMLHAQPNMGPITP